jgi:hypothetical protein
MLTSSFIFRPRRLALMVGAGALAVTAAFAGHQYLEIQDLASDRLVEFSASFKSIPDLASLNRQSDLVVIGHVVGDGTTHMVIQPGGTPKAAPPPAQPNITGKKGEALTGQSVQPAPGHVTALGHADGADPGRVTEGRTANVNLGTPITTFEIKVDRVLQGNAAAGSQVKVTQAGGHVALDTFPGGPKLQRTVEFEHDTLMKAGERQVMFLHRANDGSFFVVGGPQGRLLVDQAGNVHPIDVAAPALKGRDGQSLERFVAEHEAAK